MIGDRVDQCLEREEQEIMRHISSLKKMIKKVYTNGSITKG